jgi:amino-acid N-acetyltransferase
LTPVGEASLKRGDVTRADAGGVSLRAATAADAPAIHRLIVENLEAGHLLPRSIADVEEHAARFVVAVDDASVIGCAELAPLSDAVAEVRSLVVDVPYRGRQIGGRLVAHIAAAGVTQGFSTLCAFTHEPAHFVRLGFSIVPHIWVPEKIAHDCTGCALFRRCGQYAVTLPLRAGANVRPEPAAAVIHGRSVAARRSNIERLHLQPVAAPEEAVPA